MNENISDVKQNFDAVATAVNSLDDGNISAAAGIQVSKLASGVTGLAQGVFSVYRAAAVSYTTGQVVQFDTEELDVSGWHDITTNVGRYTPLVAGYYRLSWRVMAGSSPGLDIAWGSALAKNGAAVKFGQTVYMRGTTAFTSSVGTALVQANGSSDYFTVLTNHGVGATHPLQTGSDNTYFQGEMVGRS